MLKHFKFARHLKNHSIVGIDINTTSINAVEISNQQIPQLLSYGCIKLPENAVHSHIIQNSKAVEACLQQLFLNIPRCAKFVAIAIPDSTAINKIIQISPRLHIKDVEEIVTIEVNKFCAHPVDKISSDFKILGPSAKNIGLLDVLIIATKSENISKRVLLMESAGLKVKVVDVVSSAVERAVQHSLTANLPLNYTDKIVAVVATWPLSTQLFVFKNRKLIFLKEEETNVTEGQSWLNSIILQITKFLKLFFATIFHEKINEILLAGELTSIPTIASIIENSFGIKTSEIDIFNGMSISIKLDQETLLKKAPSFLIACGLALREIQ